MTAACTVTCEKKATINLHNDLFNLDTAETRVCGSPQVGHTDTKSQSTQCSGAYAPGRFKAWCSVDVYFDKGGQTAGPATPEWTF